LEAVYFLATATSHRTRKNLELIRKGADSAFVATEFERSSETHALSAGIGQSERRFRFDGQQLARSGDLYGHLRAVFFSPEDLILVSGSPADRRRFLDLGLCQRNPAMLRILLDYRRALKQRNALLKARPAITRGGASFDALGATLAGWDPQLASLGAKVTLERARYALELLEHAARYYRTIAPGAEDLSGGYRSSSHRATWREVSSLPGLPELESRYLKSLEKDREKDLNQKTTGAGPHRDDLLLEVGGASAPTYASQGQRRTIALAAKLAESDLLTEDGDPPVLLVDDVTHEMDEGRCKRFLETIAGKGQAILTFTEVAAHRHLLSEGSLWKVEAGTFTPTGWEQEARG
jgi:DNA replication and repair protein RecF